MSVEVTRQIDSLRRKLQWRYFAIATCWLIASIVAGSLLLVACDWLLRIQDSVGRVTCTFAMLALVILAARRWLKTMEQHRATLATVAIKIEQRYPHLRDLVTSALDFSRQSSQDIGAGSESLRRAVVIRAGSSLADVDWRTFLPSRTLHRAMFALVLMLIVISTLGWQAPTLLQVGITRIFNPFHTAEWPHQVNLQIENPPSLLAVGEDLVLTLTETGGQLPDTVTIQTRFPQSSRRGITSHAFSAAGPVQEFRLPNVRQSLEYRAVGGDHYTMPWHKLQVIAPPKIENLQVTVFPPSYTGLPSYQREAGQSVLAGSRIQISGQLSGPATSIVLRTADQQSHPTELNKDQTAFHTVDNDWQIDSSDVITIDIEFAAGLHTQARQQISLQVRPDLPPAVTFLEPTARLSVTPTASIPIAVEARDDFAVQNIKLEYRSLKQPSHQPQTIEIFTGPDNAPSPPEARRQQASYRWNLKPLNVKPGEVLEVVAQATDYQPAIGKTYAPLRIAIVSEVDLLSQITSQETNLNEILQRLHHLQTQLRDQVAEQQKQPVLTPQQQQNFVNRLLSKQRYIATALSNRHDGVHQRIDALISDLKRNGLARPATEDRLQSLQKLIENLLSQPLPAIDQALSDWHRRLQTTIKSPEPDFDPQSTLASVAKHQNQVLDLLEQAIDLISLENTLAQFENQIANLQQSQQQLADQAQQQLLQASDDIANRKNSSAARTTSEQQRQLSHNLAKLLQQMSRSAQRQTTISGQLADVVALAQDLAVQTQMDDAARHLARQHFGQAVSTQQQVIAALQQLRARLSAESTDQQNSNTDQLGSKQQSQGDQSDDQNAPEGKVGAGTEPQQSQQTSDNPTATEATSSEIAADLVREYWGDLPQRQRQQILQPLREEFLPQYAPEIEAYFRALAKPTGDR